MPGSSLEERVTALETEVARLKQEQTSSKTLRRPWWEEIRGTFKNDLAYQEAMQLGRAWRESRQPEDLDGADA